MIELIRLKHYLIHTEIVYCKWGTPHGRNRYAEVEASHAGVYRSEG